MVTASDAEAPSIVTGLVTVVIIERVREQLLYNAGLGKEGNTSAVKSSTTCAGSSLSGSYHL